MWQSGLKCGFEINAGIRFYGCAGLRLRRVRRRSRAAIAELPNRDAEHFGFVGEVFLNAGAGEDYDPDRQDFEHLRRCA